MNYNKLSKLATYFLHSISMIYVKSYALRTPILIIPLVHSLPDYS